MAECGRNRVAAGSLLLSLKNSQATITGPQPFAPRTNTHGAVYRPQIRTFLFALLLARCGNLKKKVFLLREDEFRIHNSENSSAVYDVDVQRVPKLAG